MFSKFHSTFFGIALCALQFSSTIMNAQTPFSFPPTPQKSVTETLHGVSLTDSYRWLEDKNDATVKDWTKRQHDATLAFLKETAPEIAGLNAEIAALIDRDVTSAPRYKKGREFFTRRKKGELQSKFFTKIDGKEILLFDPVALDPSGKTSISGTVLNRDASKVAIGTQTKGAEITDYRIIDTKTGKQIGETLRGIGAFSWAHDERFVFVTIRTRELIDAQKPLAVYRHKLGEPLDKAEKLIEPADAKISAYVYEPEDENVQVWGFGDFYTNTVKFRTIGDTRPPKQIYSSDTFRAYPEFIGKRIYWMTNDHAPNFKIMLSSLEKPEFEHATTLVPEGETVLEGFEVTSSWILVQDKKDVLSRITVYNFDGTFQKELPLPEVGNVASMSYDRDENVVYVTLTTFTAPAKVYKLDGTSLKWSFFYQDIVPVDLSDIEAEIKFFPSLDGTKVPLFVVHKKGLERDGSHPTLITGYGGFNSGIAPSFVGYAASFLKRGGVWVNVGIRGGDEYGEKWHLDGMMKRKQNSFDDFASAAQWLISQKYTNPQKLVAQGGSNGGLLMGAMATQHPELFRAILCQVPLLDMVRYHKFQIARFWIPEYGDPDKSEDFSTLLKYSPYHNIRAGVSLPEMLVTVGENDTRVDPLHGKKFVALAQSRPEQKSPVMLFVDFDSGHGSGKSVQQMVEDRAFTWRFIMSRLGMK